jgi:AraC family transcriptional regulator
MTPVHVRAVQGSPAVVQHAIVLPGAVVELCAFPEVVAELIQVTEAQSVLSLGLSRLLAGSAARRAGQRAPFVRFGALSFRPAGVPMEMCVGGGAFHTVRCRFAAERTAALGLDTLGEAELAACFDLRAPTVEEAMLRLAEEAAEPGRDSATLVEALLAMILVDLGRTLDAARRRGQRRRGGLAPHLLRRVLERIDRPGPPPSLDELAALAGLSRFHFGRSFRETLGISPGAFVQDARIRRARDMLADPDRSLAEIARALGYAGDAAFSAAFRKAIGRPPGAYRSCLR